MPIVSNPMIRLLSIVTLGTGLLFSGCASSTPKTPEPPGWGAGVSREIRALGVSNWIIVAESSFPIISRRGVRTMVVEAEIPEVVDYIVNDLESVSNVTASFNTARELPFVENDNAPGIDEFRRLLSEALHGNTVREMDNRSLNLLAQSDASKFAILVFKTKTNLPYSNVYIELDSGFWDRSSEDKLRGDISMARQKAAAEKLAAEQKAAAEQKLAAEQKAAADLRAAQERAAQEAAARSMVQPLNSP